MKSFYFYSEVDVIRYIEYLMQHGKEYHFDDDPMDVFCYADAICMRDNNNRLWNYTDPWVFMDRHPELWKRYTKSDAIQEEV